MPRPRKRFGQHFLHDRTIIERIVEAFDPRSEQMIVEIGPGRGALTLPLLDRVGALYAIELDRDLAERLPALAAGHGELTLYQADALRFDFAELAGGKRLRLIGNLPYNISTPLLFHLLAQADAIADMLFMLQKEIAERLAAVPGTKAYGRLTVMIGCRYESERLFDVEPRAFTPPPKVYSSVIRLRPRRGGPIAVGDPQRFADIVQAAFGQRRKVLRNSLRLLLDTPLIESVGVDPMRRGEDLTLEEFARLSCAAATADRSDR